MRKVVSVRLKEELIKEIDAHLQDAGAENRTEFILKAIDFFLNKVRKV